MDEVKIDDHYKARFCKNRITNLDLIKGYKIWKELKCTKVKRNFYI